MIKGKHHLRLAWQLTVVAWLVGVMLRAALYGRQTPYGGPFVLHWDRYFFHACFYGLFSAFAFAAPFLLWWSVRHDRPVKGAGWLHGGLLALLTAALIGDHFDHETVRFLGTHATPSFLSTYRRIGGSLAMAGRSLATDAGGPYLSAGLFVVPLLYLGWGIRAVRRGVWHGVQREVPPHFSRRGLGLALSFLPLVAVLVAINTPGGKFRLDKVQPYALVLFDELRADQSVGIKPDDFDALVTAYQEDWLAGSAGGWRFTDPARPYARTPKKPSTPADDARWNVIVLQLETLRGMEAGFMRPELSPSPTPFLDQLAADPKSAYWDRFYTFGPPTVTGFLSGHCGVRPHSRHNITTRYTYSGLLCLPALLREHGYRAEYFTGSDPDWDGQALWADRWFDQTHFYRDADELDRVVFERATDRIVELGRAGPFWATVVSISNHYPFKSREAASDIAGHEAITDRIRNTTHYTDDVVRALFERLRGEAFFERTIVVIYGDHGHNLGEHTPGGQRNGYHESTWSPFIVYGGHPRLPQGRQGGVGGLMDVAPTLADLLGFQVENPWSGHSLLTVTPAKDLVHTRNGIAFAETPTHSAVVERSTGERHLFDGDDPLQTEEQTGPEAGRVVDALMRRARDRARLNDYLIEVDRVWPRAAP